MRIINSFKMTTKLDVNQTEQISINGYWAGYSSYYYLSAELETIFKTEKYMHIIL